MTSPSQDASARSEPRSKDDASQNKQRKSRRGDSSEKSSRSSDSGKGRKESRGQERRRSNRSRSQSGEVDKNDGCVLYVNNLGQKCNEEELRTHFSKAGKVIAATLTREPYNKAPRGFGFVTYDTKDEAKNAVEMFNGTDFNGQKVGVEFSKRKNARDKTPGKYLGRSRRRRSSSDSRSRRRDGDRDYRRRDRDRDYRRRSRDRSRDRRDRSRDRRDRDRDYGGYRRNRSRDRRERSRDRRSGSNERYRRRDRS